MDSVEWARLRWQETDSPGLEYAAAVTAVMRLHQILTANLDNALRGNDISRTGYLVLSTLGLAREHRLAMSQLSKRLMLHATTISLTVDQLRTRGLVERERHPTDGRTTLAVLTPAGLAALDTITESLAAASFGFTGVTERQAITLTEVIAGVRAALGDT
jgi:DNA-binding MarR family transcriptional regulator